MTPRKNQIYGSVISPGNTVVSSRRAERGGIHSDRIDVAIERNLQLLSTEPVSCDTPTFRERPYPHPDCDFRPGNEESTAAEYAFVQNGNIHLHTGDVVPRWPRTPRWNMAVIDNKYPIYDTKTIDGIVYSTEVRRENTLIPQSDAKGKDLVILLSDKHVVTPLSIDYVTLSILEQKLTQMLFADPDIRYVMSGQNNAGLPSIKNSSYRVKAIELEQDARRLANLLAESGVCIEGIKDLIGNIQDMSGGIYENDGNLSGNSQIHPHARIISEAILPPMVLRLYEHQQHSAQKVGAKSIYEALFSEEALIVKNESDVALVVETRPDYAGQLYVVAKNAHNITEMSEQELREFAYKRQLAQCLIDVYFGHRPSNTFTIQTFGENIERYPASRFVLGTVPRTNVHGFKEIADGIPVVSLDPYELAATYRQILPIVERIINQRSYASTPIS